MHLRPESTLNNPPTHKDVDMLAVQLLLELRARVGLGTDGLLDGLPLTLEQTRSRKHGVAWDTYVELCDRTRDELGGNDAMADASAAEFQGLATHLSRFAALFVSPHHLVQFLARVVDPRMWPCLKTSWEEFEPGLGQVVHELPAHYRSGESVFHGAIGAWRSVPRHLGLPEAELLEVSISPHRASYLMRLPRPRTISARARQAATAAFAHYATEELEVEAAFAHVSFATRTTTDKAAVERAGEQWKLTAREQEVLGLVLQGLSNKEIAGTLDCAVRTAEVHVANLLKKSGMKGRTQLVAGFWKR